MGELKEKYEGKVTFEVVSANSDEGKAADKKYKFGGARHGLVGLDPDGELEILIPGHNYSKAHIEEQIDKMLAP